MNPQLSNLLFERYPSIFRLHTRLIRACPKVLRVEMDGLI
jgi:hypothetical protein